MASQTPLSLGLLFLVLCLTHGSARKLIPDAMLKDTTGLARQLSDDPTATIGELMSSSPMPNALAPSDGEVMSTAPMTNEPTGLDEAQVACGRPVEVLAPYRPNCPYNCPSCACGNGGGTTYVINEPAPAPAPGPGIVVYVPTPTPMPMPNNNYPPTCQQPGCQGQTGNFYPGSPIPNLQPPNNGFGPYPACGEPACQLVPEPVCTSAECQFVPPYPTVPRNLPESEPIFPASVGKPPQATAGGEVQSESLKTTESSLLEGGSPGGSH